MFDFHSSIEPDDKDLSETNSSVSGSNSVLDKQDVSPAPGTFDEDNFGLAQKEQQLRELAERLFSLREQHFKACYEYQDRLIVEIESGTNKEYLRKYKELESSRVEKLRMARELKRRKLEKIERVLLGEEYAETCNVTNDERLLHEKYQRKYLERKAIIHQELLEKKQKPNIVCEDLQPQKQSVRVSGPYVIYNLNDEDIDDDLKLMRQLEIEKYVENEL